MEWLGRNRCYVSVGCLKFEAFVKSGRSSIGSKICVVKSEDGNANWKDGLHVLMASEMRD